MYNHVFMYKSGTMFHRIKVRKGETFIVSIKAEINSGEANLEIANKLTKEVMVKEPLLSGTFDYELSEGKYCLKLIFKKTCGKYSVLLKRKM